MDATLDIIQADLEPWQKRNRLAQRAESLLPAPGLTPEVAAFLEAGILCTLFEGNAPFRPRYVVPDYARLLRQGSPYLGLAPARDLWEAVDALLTAYRFVPSITGMPVYVGQVDELLEPYWEAAGPATGRRLVALLLSQIEKTLPDGFVHLNLGPRETHVGRTVLELEREACRAVPNISLKVSPETPESLLTLAVETALETGKPYFVNHPEVLAAVGRDYGVASCYNTLPLGGGSHTLVRLHLGRLAQDCDSPDAFLAERLPQGVAALTSLTVARSRYLVETSGFFEHSFLVREGLVDPARFTAMAGVFGLFEAVETLTGGLRMGHDDVADALAEAIVSKARELVKAVDAPHCQGTGGRLAFHAQSGIAADTDATPGVRIRPGEEPELPRQMALAQRLQTAFDAGVSEILTFDPTARRSPAGVVRIVRGALQGGLRILALSSADSGTFRISGYLVKRADVERVRAHENLREETAALGEEAIRNGRGQDRRVVALLA